MAKALLALILTLGFSAFHSFIVQLLWNNCLIGAVDGVHELGFLQAWGIYLMCALLFKARKIMTIDKLLE
jgi:hypothetical protein